MTWRHHPLTALLLAVASSPSLVRSSTTSILPYKPTTLLTLEDTLYLFQDRSFASLNTSTAANLTVTPDWTTITDELPFVGDTATSTYVATLANDTLVVYAGDCKEGSGSLWVYDPAAKSWSRKSVANGANDAPFLLGAAVGFASTIDPQEQASPNVYAFGGMCGTPSSSVWAWQSASDYTSVMVRLSANSQAASANYNASKLTGLPAPVAAAGFSWTATTPALASKADTVSQQVDYVMIGGHTASAFVNTSSVAVWNLPDESWSFVSVGNHGAVSSRSGHSAVLSEDGSSLVLVGGWVSQVTKAADPQLVVLKMSDSDKGWSWEIPKNQPSGNGIYGHGAAVLPGNVLMIYGGYDVGAPSSKREISGSSQYYNMTSGEWSTTYSNPSAISSGTSSTTGVTSTATSTSSSDSSSASSNSTHNLIIGLAVGLGIPALLILIALIIYLCCRRRSKKMRDAQIRALAQDEAHFLPADNTMAERGKNNNWYNNKPSTNYRPAPLVRDSAYGSLQSPGESPVDERRSIQLPRGQRLGNSRGGYMAAGTVADQIDPIYENDDTSYDRHRSKTHSQYDKIAQYSPDGDMGARVMPAPLMTDIHRPPPVDDDDDYDNYNDDLPISTHVTTRGAINAMNDDFDDAELLEGFDHHNRQGCTEIRNALAAVEGRPGSKESSTTYSTARSNFVALRNEGPSLLMGNTRPGTATQESYSAIGPSTYGGEHRYDEHGHVYNYDDDDDNDVPGSPSKYRAHNSWLGSLRRVFSTKTGGSDSSTIPSPTRQDSIAGPTEAFNTLGDYESRIPGLTGLSNRQGVNNELFRRKQGRQAWEDMPAHLRGGLEGNESEWDIERAVEQRLVQVMFTVPKERLRVVNAEIEREEEVMIVNPDESEEASLVSNAGDISGSSNGISLRYEPATETLGDGDLGEARRRYRRETRGTRANSMANDGERLMVGSLRGGMGSSEGLRGKRSLSPMVMKGRSPYLEASDVSSLRYSGELKTAEILRLEKPRSLVRAIVDSIESQSQEGSPVNSLRGVPKGFNNEGV